MAADQVDEFFEELRREYLAEAPARLAELRKDLAALRAGEPDAAQSLKGRFHRLAGSGGSYGFPSISHLSRDTERWIASNPTLDAAGCASLDQAIARVAGAFDAGAEELGLPTSSAANRPAFAWQALIGGDEGPAVARVRQALTHSGYTTRVRPVTVAPTDLPVSERADLVALVPADRAELDQMLEQWATPSANRPLQAGLIVAGGLVPGLDPRLAGVDFVFRPEQIETEFLAHIQAFGRAATSPPVIAVVHSDGDTLARIKTWFESAGMRVVAAASGADAQEVFEREVPDLVALSWSQPDTTGGAFVRWLRRLPNLRLTPVLGLAAKVTDADRIAALGDGADDLIELPKDQLSLIKLVSYRVERGRQLRAYAHRDELTGLSNQPTFLEELERASSYARRVAEQFAVVVLDIDHFRRVNELHGYAAGNAVLAGVARAIGAAIRSSDVAARIGGEEFAVLARRCSPEHILTVVDKVRRSVAAETVTVGEATVTVRLSAGVACYPTDANTTPALFSAALVALGVAKSSGRDRIAMSAG